MSDTVPIKDAATTIVLRDRDSRPRVLMGQRGQGAVFMPGKFVFPGGAVDANDHTVPVGDLAEIEKARLSDRSALSPDALIAASIRELWEETGLILGRPAPWSDAPQGWRGFAASGHRPNGAACRMFFRAVTPIGRPRRFDARFLLVEADALVSDPDDFGRAEDELSHLQWVALDEARNFDLPFITQVVLSELIAHVAGDGRIDTVPFFQNNDEQHLVSRLGGRAI